MLTGSFHVQRMAVFSYDFSSVKNQLSKFILAIGMWTGLTRLRREFRTWRLALDKSMCIERGIIFFQEQKIFKKCPGRKVEGYKRTSEVDLKVETSNKAKWSNSCILYFRPWGNLSRSKVKKWSFTSRFSSSEEWSYFIIDLLFGCVFFLSISI